MMPSVPHLLKIIISQKLFLALAFVIIESIAIPAASAKFDLPLGGDNLARNVVQEWRAIAPAVSAQPKMRIFTLAESPASPTVYNWQGVDGDWQLPSNWSPVRTMPASDDVLVFNPGGTITVTNVPTQTIGQLIVSGNSTVNLQSAAAIVLTIAGGDGDDLVVDRNSALNFGGSSEFVVNLASGFNRRHKRINDFFVVRCGCSSAHGR